MRQNKGMGALRGHCNSFSFTFPCPFAPVMFSWTRTFSFGSRLSESVTFFLLCFLFQLKIFLSYCIFWNPSLSFSVPISAGAIVCLLLFPPTHFALCLTFLHLLWLFLIVQCTYIFSIPLVSLAPPYVFWYFYLYSVISLSSSRSGFFCALFPPRILIHYFFFDISPFSFPPVAPPNLSIAFGYFRHIHPLTVSSTQQLSLIFRNNISNGNSLGRPKDDLSL